MQHVLDIPDGHRKLDGKHRCQAYGLRAGLGVAKMAGSCHLVNLCRRVVDLDQRSDTIQPRDQVWRVMRNRGASCRPAPGRWSRWLLAAIGVYWRGVSGLRTGPVSVHPVATPHRRSSEPGLRAETLRGSLLRPKDSVVAGPGNLKVRGQYRILVVTKNKWPVSLSDAAT